MIMISQMVIDRVVQFSKEEVIAFYEEHFDMSMGKALKMNLRHTPADGLDECKCGRCSNCKITRAYNASISLFYREKFPGIVRSYAGVLLSEYVEGSVETPLRMKDAVKVRKAKANEAFEAYTADFNFTAQLVNAAWITMAELAASVWQEERDMEPDEKVAHLAAFVFDDPTYYGQRSHVEVSPVFTQGGDSSDDPDIFGVDSGHSNPDIRLETEFSTPSPETPPGAPRASFNAGSFFGSGFVPEEFAQHKDANKLVKQIETYGAFVATLSLQTSWVGFGAVTALFLNTHFGISLVDPTYRWVTAIVDAVREAVPVKQQGGDGHSPLDDNTLFHSLANCWAQISSSIFVQKLKKFAALLSALLASTVLGTKLDGEKFAELWKSLSEKANCVDLFAQLLHNVLWILDRGVAVISGERKFMDIFSSETVGQSFDIRYARLMGSVDKLEASTGDELYSPEQALMLIVKMRTECELLMRSSKSKAENVMFGRQIKDLEALAFRINIIAANSEIRRAPFAISINGDTGVGKSANVGVIVATLQNALDIGKGSRFVHSHNSDDKYFSGYTAYTNTIILDDIGNTKEQFVDESPSNVIIAIINNQPRFAVMADVTDKGKLAIRPDVVIGTTNVKDLRSEVYTNNALSMLRRFKYHITMTVKDEFKKEGTDMMDPSVDPAEHRHDVWLYHVEEALANTRSASERESDKKSSIMWSTIVHEEKPLIGISFSELLTFLVQKARIHKEQQTRLVARSLALSKAEMCAHSLPTAVCKECVETQAGTFWVAGWTAWDYVNALLLLREYRTPLITQYFARLYTGYFMIYLAICFMLSPYALFAWFLGAFYATLSAGLTTAVHGSLLFCTDLAAMRGTGEGVFDIFNATDRMTRLARRGQQAIRNHYKMAGAALIVVSGMYTAYVMFHRVRTSTQGAEYSRPKPPDIKPLADPWRRPSVERNMVNPDLKHTTGKQLAEALVSRVCLMRVHDDDTAKGVQCLCFPVKTGFWLAPYHILVKQYKRVTIQQWGEEALNGSHTFFREDSFVRVGESDFALMYVPGKGDTKDFLPAFPERIPQLDARAARVAWAKRVENADGYARLEKGVACVNVTTAVVSPQDCDYSYHGGNYEFTQSTWNGLCGAPLVVEGGGTFILGVHSAGQTGTGTARYGTVLRGEIQAAISKLCGEHTVCMQGASSSGLKFDYPDHNFAFCEGIKEKSKCNWVEGEYTVLGHHSGQPRTFRSKVVKTSISDAVAEVMGEPCVTGKPAYINSWVPWHMWLKSCADPRPLPFPDLNRAYNCLKGKVFDYLESHADLKEKIHPLPDDNVLAGADGVKGCYALNFNASAGIPWCVPKKEFMVDSEREVEGVTCPKDIPEWLHAEIALAEERLAKGERINAPHRCNLKDEPIGLDKAKVRVFSGTNMVYLFLMRRYFLTISMLMQELPELFECAIGINCFSEEWERLYEHVTQHGLERTIAGDYKGYDQLISAQVTMAAFKLLIAIAEWAGFDERQLCIMRGLATETCFPIYEMDGEVLQLNSSNPSGHSLTGVINNIANCFYMRFTFYRRQPKGDTTRFHEAVALICYGDDNKMTVSARTPWFTHTAIQEELALYGIVYTMADKSAGSIPYVHDSQASFLKRYFVPDVELNRVLCPLEQKSIFKSLHTVVRSDFMSLEEQTAECVRNANREFFFHGKEEFSVRHEQLNSVVDIAEMRHYLPGGKLQSYDEVLEWYLSQ